MSVIRTTHYPTQQLRVVNDMNNIVICSQGPMPFRLKDLELISQIYEDDQRLEAEIKRRWTDATKKFAETIDEMMMSSTSTSSCNKEGEGVFPGWMSEMIELKTNRVDVCDMHHVMSYYSHIIDGPKTGVILHV